MQYALYGCEQCPERRDWVDELSPLWWTRDDWWPVCHGCDSSGARPHPRAAPARHHLAGQKPLAVMTLPVETVAAPKTCALLPPASSTFHPPEVRDDGKPGASWLAAVRSPAAMPLATRPRWVSETPVTCTRRSPGRNLVPLLPPASSPFHPPEIGNTFHVGGPTSSRFPSPTASTRTPAPVAQDRPQSLSDVRPRRRLAGRSERGSRLCGMVRRPPGSQSVARSWGRTQHRPDERFPRTAGSLTKLPIDAAPA